MQSKHLSEKDAVVPIAMTVKAAAEYSSIGRSKLYEYMRAGLLPVVKVGRATRIRTADLEALIEKLTCHEVNP